MTLSLKNTATKNCYNIYLNFIFCYQMNFELYEFKLQEEIFYFSIPIQRDKRCKLIY